MNRIGQIEWTKRRFNRSTGYRRLFAVKRKPNKTVTSLVQYYQMKYKCCYIIMQTLTHTSEYEHKFWSGLIFCWLCHLISIWNFQIIWLKQTKWYLKSIAKNRNNLRFNGRFRSGIFIFIFTRQLNTFKFPQNFIGFRSMQRTMLLSP